MAPKDVSILANELKHMQDAIDRIEKDTKENNANLVKLFSDHIKKEEAFYEAIEKKFANKWVEQVVGGAISIILVSVFTALIYLVIQK